MASRVNTKFLLIVFLSFGLVASLLGGVYVLKLRGDATRSFRKGEEAWERADYRNAFDQFGRAVHKDPGNPEYLQRYEQALLMRVPESPIEARELYGQQISILNHAVLHNPRNAEAHQRLLSELHNAARRINMSDVWDRLASAASSMHQQLPEGDPAKPIAEVYRALAIAKLSNQRTDAEVAQALEDLKRAVMALPDNDLAWSARLLAEMALARRLEISGRGRTTIDQQLEELERALDQAIEATPQGPETAVSHLLGVLDLHRRDRAEATPQRLRAAADRVMELVTPQVAPGVIIEAASLMQMVPEVGRSRSIAILERSLEAHPDAHDQRVLLAQFKMAENVDVAQAEAERVLEAPQLPVSLLSQLQFDLRRQAASLLVDIDFRRWELAPAAERAAQLEKVQQTRNRLAGLVPDANSDPLVMRADARLAYARNDLAEAAQKFETLVRLSNGNDVEVLSFAAIALERVNQIGLAYERISAAAALNPQHTPLLAEKARMELRLQRFEQARQTIAAIPESVLNDPRTDRRVVEMVMAIRRAEAGGSLPTDDPVQTAIAQANEALGRGEPDNARAALLAALDQNPEQPQQITLLQALAQVEMRTGNREKAIEYAQRGLALSPTDTLLRQIDIGLRVTDPIQASRDYLSVVVPNERDRAEATLIAMAGMMQQQRAAAEQQTRAGQVEAAARATELANRAETEADAAAAQLEGFDPENARLLEYRFSRALQAKDWTRTDQLLTTIKQLNLDEAGGLFYAGRAQLSRGNHRDAVVLLEQASERLSFSSGVWRALATAYQNLGNFAQAERAYEQAYRCNPNDIDGARAYVAIMLRRGDRDRALQILRAAHRLAPQDRTLRETWLSLEEQVGDKVAAMRERERLLAADPANVDNAASLAMMLVNLEPTREVLVDEYGQPLFGQQRWATMASLERDEIVNSARETWRARSRQIVEQLERTLGDDLRLAVIRAHTLRQSGDVLGGETVLRSFIERKSEARDEDMYIELARYQVSVNQYADAVDTLRQAVALGGEKQFEAEKSLGLTLMQLGRHAEALEPIESALARQDDQGLRLQAIECMVRIGRFDDAEKQLQEAAGGAGGSVTTMLSASIAEGRADALLAQGRIDEAQRLFAQQRDLLSKAETQDPTNPIPRVLVAQSLLKEFQRTRQAALLEDALLALDRAQRLRVVPEIGIVRVAVLKAKNDKSGAMEELRRILQADPDNIVARRDLVQMHVEVGDPRGAIEALESAIRQNPTVAAWHEMRGDLLGEGGDVAQAVAAYDKAYDLAPSSGMLFKLVRTMLAGRQPNCRAAVDRLAPVIDVNDASVLREAYAEALACLGRKDEAIEQLRLAYAKRKDDPQYAATRARDQVNTDSWFVSLGLVFPSAESAEAEKLLMEVAGGQPGVLELRDIARLWSRSLQTGMSRAIELQRQAVLLCPADDASLRAILNEDLAKYLLVTGDMRGAAEAYDVVLRIQPENANALNNLAYLKAEELNDAASAVPLAERLLRLDARNPDVLDTVGWVYFKNGDLERAKLHLMESVAIKPQPGTYIHLAEVLAGLNDSAGAQTQLQEAEKFQLDAQTRQKVQSLRDDMEKSRAPGQ